MNTLLKLAPLTALLILSGCDVFDGNSDAVPVNKAPIASDLLIGTVTDTPTRDQLPARDPDGDDLTFTIVDLPTSGMVILESNGVFTYTPTEEFNGNDQFTFQVNDGELTSMVATVDVTVNIKPVNFSSYSRTVYEKNANDSPQGVNNRHFNQDVVSTNEYQDLVSNGSQ